MLKEIGLTVLGFILLILVVAALKSPRLCGDSLNHESKLRRKKYFPISIIKN